MSFEPDINKRLALYTMLSPNGKECDLRGDLLSADIAVMAKMTGLSLEGLLESVTVAYHRTHVMMAEVDERLERPFELVPNDPAKH